MKQNYNLLAILLLLGGNLSYGQSFLNGDLNGTVNGISCLPNNWQNVPYTDPNCLATQFGDTPDLTDLNGPIVAVGMNGNPFSGNTFISGGIGGNMSNFGHEGIMQPIYGFTVGNEYIIHFRQTVAKASGLLDNSGSWAVYIDTVLAEITAPTYSNEQFNSINLQWEARSIHFIATSTSHFIKFLPMDDDTNHIDSSTDTTGALYMGIDSIGLSVVTGTNEMSNSSIFKIFPNPAKDVLKLEMQYHFTGAIKISNALGKEMYTSNIEKNISYFSIDLTKFPCGFYFVSFGNENGVVNKKFVKE